MVASKDKFESRLARYVTMLLATVTLSAPPAVADLRAVQTATFLHALQDYSKDEYRQAYDLFRRVLLKDPDNGLCRYYLANTLVRLGLIDKAVDQYKIALWLSKDPTVQGYCRAALAAANQFSTENSPTGAAQITSSDINSPSNASDDGGYAAAAGTIADQAMQQQRLFSNSSIQARNRAYETKQYASQLQSNAEQIANQYRVWGPRGSYMPADAQAWLAAQCRMAASLNSLAAEWQSAEANIDGMREQATQDAADSLQLRLQQASTQPQNSFRLLQNGTNLYVQNFSAPSEPPPVPLVAVPHSLRQLQHGAKGKAGRLSDDPDSLFGQRKVRALLLDPKHKMEVDN